MIGSVIKRCRERTRELIKVADAEIRHVGAGAILCAVRDEVCVFVSLPVKRITPCRTLMTKA